MDKPCIYTDCCSQKIEDQINQMLGLEVVKTIPADKWNINDALSMATIPTIKLVVFNVIDEITIIESGLLSFLCKPILITDKDINDYPVLKSMIYHTNTKSNLTIDDSEFIEWYNRTIKE